MSNVFFKRSTNVNSIPIMDGQLIFDETYNKIYMDNGNERLQYGGDVSLISNPDLASTTNAYSAEASSNLFAFKDTVVDVKGSALAVTEHHIPLGCLAFKEALGTQNYSSLGDGTISGALMGFNNQLTANSNRIYMDYHDGKYGINTSSSRGADTFIPFRDLSHYEVTIVGSVSNRTTNSVDGQVGEGTANFTIKLQINDDGTCTVTSGSLVNHVGTSVRGVSACQVNIGGGSTSTISSVTVTEIE